MIPLLIGAGVGLAKGMLDKEQEKKDRQTQAEIQRWSPWTGMQGQQVQGANVLGSTMQGAMAGGMLGGAMGGGAAAGGAAEGGAMATTDPGAAASLTGGQSAAPAAGYGTQAAFDQSMAQKYPWLAMQ